MSYGSLSTLDNSELGSQPVNLMKQPSEFEVPIEKAIRKRDVKYECKIAATKSDPMPNLDRILAKEQQILETRSQQQQ